MWFMECLIQAISLIIITFLAGQPLYLILSRQYDFLTVERFCLSLLFGTFTISYLFFIGTYCNLPGMYLGPIILLVIFLLNIQLRDKLYFRVREKNIYQFFAVCFTAIFISLLPILVHSSISPYNDTIGYISISDYLYNHGFLKKYPDTNVYTPLNHLILMIQNSRARAGGSFFLTAVQSIFGMKNSIFIFPVAQTCAMITTLASITISSYWIFNLKWKYILVTLILVTVTFNPLYYSVHNGFYHQLYGCAFLMATLASFTRLIQNANSKNNNRFIFITAIFLSALVLFYPELFLFAALILAMSMFAPFIRRNSNNKRWLLTLIVLGLVTTIISNVGVVSLIGFLKEQIGCVVGRNITYSNWEFTKTAFGIMPINSFNLGLNFLGAFFLLLFFFALYKIVRKNYLRYITWLCTIFVFTSVFLYFHFFVANPWVPNTQGQTWSLFKLVNWVYPVLIIGVGYGISKLKQKKIFVPLVVITSLWVGKVSHPYYYNQLIAVNTLTSSEHPLTSFGQFAAAINTLHITQPIELRTAVNNKLLAYFLNPIPVSSDWTEDPYLGFFKNVKLKKRHYMLVDTPDVITTGAIKLPANVSLIESDMAYIKEFKGWYDLEANPEGNFRWTTGNASINFNYDKGRGAKIKFDVVVATNPTKLIITVSNNKTIEILIKNKQQWNPVEFLVNLKKGDNSISLSSDIKPIRIGDDPRLLAFAVRNLKIEPVN